jgi:phosphoserine phosphatase
LKYQSEESESHELESGELEEVRYAAARSPAGAAFFDIDGTLLAKPSLERRFFWELRRRGKIPARNYFAWLAETLRPGLRSPRDLRAIVQTNKSYLRGVHAEIPSRVNPSSAHAGNATSSNATSRNATLFSTASGSADHGGALPGSWLPEFFPAAIQRVWWHALRGDAIALVSGTLAPLAEIVQFALQRELLWRGVECKIFSIATELEAADGCWTGSVAGAAIFGEEKALTIKEFARAQNISLSRCSAYGDSSLDRWMLAAVDHAFAVNPTRRLRRLARLRGWQILHWTHCAVRTASEQRAASEQKAASERRAASEQRIANEQPTTNREHRLKKSLKLKREAAR